MKYTMKFYYLRETSIKWHGEKNSEDGESQAYVSDNPQCLLVCHCDLVYKLATQKEAA